MVKKCWKARGRHGEHGCPMGRHSSVSEVGVVPFNFEPACLNSQHGVYIVKKKLQATAQPQVPPF